MSLYYRRDGTPYPVGMEGTLEWAKDFKNTRLKRVKQTTLRNGLWVSTVWMGLNHSFLDGRPKIFESMVFLNSAIDAKPLDRRMYATEDEAVKGHKALCKEWKDWAYAKEIRDD